MTTQRESATVEGRISWLEGAYIQVNERLGALERSHQGLRAEVREDIAAVRAEIAALRAEVSAEIAALSRRLDAMQAEMNRLRADMNRQTLIVVGLLGAMWATMAGGFISLVVTGAAG